MVRERPSRAGGLHFRERLGPRPGDLRLHLGEEVARLAFLWPIGGGGVHDRVHRHGILRGADLYEGQRVLLPGHLPLRRH